MKKFILLFITSFTFSTITDIDGNVYQTIQIGEQIWMAENLKVNRYNNGDDITTYSFNSVEYGRLYDWYAATDDRGVCPSGFYIPSEQDFLVLENFLNNEGEPGSAGGKMKECSEDECPASIFWDYPNTGASNQS